MKMFFNRLLIIGLFLTIMENNGYSHCPFCDIPIISLNKDFNSSKIGLNYNQIYFYIFNFGSEIKYTKGVGDLAFYGGLGFTPLLQAQYSFSIKGQQEIRFRTDLSTMIVNEFLLNSSINSDLIEKLCKLNISFYIDKTIGDGRSKNYFGFGIGYIFDVLD